MSMIKEVIIDLNPWWKERFKIDFKQRDVYKKIQKFIPLPQIIALTGLRRVGKTTLILKVVEDYIKRGWNPKNIIYFSFDEFRELDLRDIIKEYEEIMEVDFKKGKNLLLLDELQKVLDWENQLKTIYDLYKGKTKILISGSESLFIKRKSKETLAGRVFEFLVEQLSFQEFLIFKDKNYKQISLYKGELSKLFSEFILMQGFPELVGIHDKDIIKKYIKESIVEKVLYRDIPDLFKVKDIRILESLLNIIIDEPGQLVEISKLANTLKISRQTLSNYLSYLEESYLVKKLYNFSKSRRKVERKLKKYYPSIISTNLMFRDDTFSRSKVFEWLIVNLLKAEFFWRDPYKNEVDIVLTGKKITPIEIKYGKINFKPLIMFMKKFDVNEAFIISKGIEEKRVIDKYLFSIVPGFKFLLERNSYLCKSSTFSTT